MSDSSLVPACNPAQGLTVPGLHGDVSLAGAGRPRILTSLDSSQPGQRELLYKALAEIDASGREGVGTELQVTHFVLRDSRRRDLQTQELVPCLQLVLIGPDGANWATTSEWAIESFHLLAGLSSYPPWNPPRTISVREVRTRGGFSTYKLFDVTRPAGAHAQDSPADGKRRK